MENTEIERLIKSFCKENPNIHISRVLKALGKNQEGSMSIFDIAKDNRKIVRLIDEYYLPKEMSQIVDREFEYDPQNDMSIYFLLDWGEMVLVYYANIINTYLSKKEQYETKLFSQKYDEANFILQEIIKEFGFSEYICYQKLLLYNLSDTLLGKDDFYENYNEFKRNGFLKLIFIYYEKMANPTISYEDYSQSINKLIEKKDIKGISEKYIDYKLNIKGKKEIQEIKSALIIDEQISLVDYYETYIDVLQNLYSLKKSKIFKNLVFKLKEIIFDYRIYNLYIALGGTLNENHIDAKVNSIFENYTIGNYAQLNQFATKNETNFDIANVYLKSNINIGKMDTPYKELWNSIFLIYNLDYELNDMLGKIGGFYKLLYNTSWRYKLLGILSRKLKSIKNDRTLFLSIINDRYLTPLFFPVIIDYDAKNRFLNMFKEVAKNTMNLHKYVLTGKLEDSVKYEVEPIRIKYYTIRRKMEENDYFETMKLCESFLDDIYEDENKSYYQERIRRILFLNYIKKELWIRAMQLYVKSYLLIKELVIRMPLAALAEGIMKEIENDSSICYDICTPIILRLYFKGDDREVISAYLEYLEGQECKTLVEYINRKEQLNPYEIFFLYNVCTETLLVRDYVSTSIINGNAMDLRILVLKTLLIKDPSNLKRYFEELNALYKEIQLQARRESFNHNRIFIDKTKLLEYVNDAVNEQFSEYSKVQEIKRLYENEKGIYGKRGT